MFVVTGFAPAAVAVSSTATGAVGFVSVESGFPSLSESISW